MVWTGWSTYHANSVKVPSYETESVEAGMCLQDGLYHVGAELRVSYPLELS